jgi:hypothetical protein
VNVLDRLPDLMTPEQRSNTQQLLQNFKKDVSGLRHVLTSSDAYRGIY